jgi:hypothetical protein
MGLNLKEHIRTKAHDASIKKLKTKRVPEKIISSMGLSFLEDIAESLTEVTHSTFLYTGGLTYESDKIVAKFTSSETKNVIKMIVSYNKDTMEEEYKFDSLNDVIEDNLKKEEKTPVPKKTPAKKKKTVKEPKKVEEQVAPSPKIPNFTKMVDTAIEIGNKEKEEEKRQKVQEMVDNSLSELDKLENTDKINKILDALEEQVPVKKKEDKLFSILKNV